MQIIRMEKGQLFQMTGLQPVGIQISQIFHSLLSELFCRLQLANNIQLVQFPLIVLFLRIKLFQIHQIPMLHYNRLLLHKSQTARIIIASIPKSVKETFEAEKVC